MLRHDSRPHGLCRRCNRPLVQHSKEPALIAHLDWRPTRRRPWSPWDGRWGRNAWTRPCHTAWSSNLS